MRIIAGQYKGARLVAPKGNTTRPTTDRTREALFNVLAHADWAPNLEGARVIDGFAGSGALGFEALSRGAAFVLFVDTNPAARGAIRTNADALEVMGRTRIHRRDATKLGQKPAGVGAPFDLVFLDPPYGGRLGEAAMSTLATGDWLTDGAIVMLEESARAEVQIAEHYTLCDTRPYGDTIIRFLRYSAA